MERGNDVVKNRPLIVCLLVLLLTACGIPIPPDKADYVGEWKSVGMSLVITSDGAVDYKRTSGGFSKSVSGPIKAFDGDNFIVGILFFATTFEVSVPPHNDNGSWKMVVDGVELTRVWP